MALRAQSTCTQAVSSMLMADPKISSTLAKPAGSAGVLPLPVKPKFQRSQLRRTKSRKPVRSCRLTPVSAAGRQDVAAVDATTTETISQAVSKVGEEIATTSGDILDAVESVIDDGPAAMRVRKPSAGKANSRTSRRRALVMCLALGMVRPCASNVASSLQANDNLRRTSSATVRRTSSSSFKVPSNLVSQVSLASTLKQTNLLGENADLQKLTTLQ